MVFKADFYFFHKFVTVFKFCIISKVYLSGVDMKKICVFGLGYIGLPTASILATKGYSVLGVDVNSDVVETINRGKIHIVEPDLDILVKSAVNSGNLKASLEPEESDIFFICVPTPFKEGYKPDLIYVEKAVESIKKYVRKGNLVVLESTSPVGTTKSLVAGILRGSGLNIGEELFIAHAPERVLPGHILRETIENDRIIGGINRKSAEVCRDFYETFVKGEIFLTNSDTAELAKLVENSYRDVNIAFANELAEICDKLGINVWELINLANRHPRVNILSPGPGVGGHCLAVDPWFIVDSAPETAKLIRAAREINEHRPYSIIEKVKKHSEKFKHPVIGCLGISYKPDIDDIRESPALTIVEGLMNLSGAEILVNDPYMKKDFGKIVNIPLDLLLKRSDIIVLLVNHKQYKTVDRAILSEKIVIDTRGVFS